MSMLPFTLTDAARDQIRALGGHLRIALEAGGCCGTAYVFTLEDVASDLHFAIDDFVIRLSPEAVLILEGAHLDYGARIKPPRFRVLRNPNTPERCACNRSFGKPFPGKATPQCRAYEPMPWNAG